jgi:hypothetical protein
LLEDILEPARSTDGNWRDRRAFCVLEGVRWLLKGLRRNMKNYQVLLGEYLIYTVSPPWPQLQQTSQDALIRKENARMRHSEFKDYLSPALRQAAVLGQLSGQDLRLLALRIHKNMQLFTSQPRASLLRPFWGMFVHFQLPRAVPIQHPAVGCRICQISTECRQEEQN